jgi:hypothetical protein
MTHWPSNSLRANHGRPANTYIHATVALSKSAACSLPPLILLRHLRLRSVPLACSACLTLTSSTIRPFVWSLRINRPATSVHCPATWTLKGLNRTLPLSGYHVKLEYHGFSGRNADGDTYATGRKDHHRGAAAACLASLRAVGRVALEG